MHQIKYRWLVKIDGTYTQLDQGFFMMEFDDKEKGYSAVIYIMESTNSVVVHFGGFNDLRECRYFSSHIMEDFGIEQLLNVPQGVTVH